MNRVWILEAGEDSEGGRVLGVYQDKDLAFSDFYTEATALHTRFGSGIDKATQDEDGSLYIHSGCDWVTLTPHDVVQRPAIEDAVTAVNQLMSGMSR